MLDLLTEERFAEVLRSGQPAHRERLYSPLETLAMFVSQSLSDDRSCQRAVDERVARSLARGTPTPSGSTAAYCEARQRLPLPLVSELCREVARRARDLVGLEHDTLLACERVFEINGSRFLSRRERRKRHVTIQRPPRPPWMDKERYAAAPPSVTLRVVISRRKGCRDKTSLSSMLDHASCSSDRVRELHGRRWGVESDFKAIEDVLGAGVLACRTPEMIVKELWAHLLGYNLVRLLACEAARTHGREPREISFRHTAQMWSAWAMLGEAIDERRWPVLLDRIAQRRVGNRPGRREPRAIKRRPKPRALLDLPGPLARCCCRAHERR